MAWIESHQALGGHRKLRHLVRLLKISYPQAVGHLHYLWWWALDNAPDADMSAIENADIADAAMWKRDPDSFVEALISAGFIDSPSKTLHDWGDYAGKLISQREKRREDNRDSQRRHRAKLGTCQQSVIADVADSKHTTVPNPTVPNPTLPTSFNAFWKAYPRKIAKGKAEKVFIKLKPDEKLLSSILAAIELAKKSQGWNDNNGKFIPHPATWLNDRRWEDEIIGGGDNGKYRGNPSQKPAGAFSDIETD